MSPNIFEQLSALEPLAEELNEASDAVNPIIANVEARLAELGLGVDASTVLYPGPVDESGGEGLPTLLTYQRGPDGWGIYLRTPEEPVLFRLAKAVRQARCDAIERLPQLVDAVEAAARARLAHLRDAKASTGKTLLGAFMDAAGNQLLIWFDLADTRVQVKGSPGFTGQTIRTDGAIYDQYAVSSSDAMGVVAEWHAGEMLPDGCSGINWREATLRCAECGQRCRAGWGPECICQGCDEVETSELCKRPHARELPYPSTPPGEIVTPSNKVPNSGAGSLAEEATGHACPTCKRYVCHSCAGRAGHCPNCDSGLCEACAAEKEQE